jgi:hypothetical protein
MDMGKASIIILRGLFGLFLALVLLIFVLVGKVYGLLLLILVFGLLFFVFREKPKTILLWLVKTIAIGLAGPVLAFGLCVLWNTWCIYFYAPERGPMFTSTSPSGRFSVSAYPSPAIYLKLVPAGPGRGQGGDRPALFILRDNRTGKDLRREHVCSNWESYATVDWGKDRVSLARGDVVWRLPP